MRKFEIQAVCGFGVGSSMLLKMKLSEAFKKNGIEANVFTGDMATANSTKCDAIFTSGELAEALLKRAVCPIIVINSFVNKVEIEEKVLKFVREFNG